MHSKRMRSKPDPMQKIKKVRAEAAHEDEDEDEDEEEDDEEEKQKDEMRPYDQSRNAAMYKKMEGMNKKMLGAMYGEMMKVKGWSFTL